MHGPQLGLRLQRCLPVDGGELLGAVGGGVFEEEGVEGSEVSREATEVIALTTTSTAA